MNKTEFIEIIYKLCNNLKDKPANFENTTLDSFLEAMISYTEDIQGHYQNTGQEVYSGDQDFKIFADILRGAAVYE